jgi:hypothetical protein
VLKQPIIKLIPECQKVLQESDLHQEWPHHAGQQYTTLSGLSGTAAAQTDQGGVWGHMQLRDVWHVCMSCSYCHDRIVWHEPFTTDRAMTQMFCQAGCCTWGGTFCPLSRWMMVSRNFRQRSSISSWNHWQPEKAAALGRAEAVTLSMPNSRGFGASDGQAGATQQQQQQQKQQQPNTSRSAAMISRV